MIAPAAVAADVRRAAAGSRLGRRCPGGSGHRCNVGQIEPFDVEIHIDEWFRPGKTHGKRSDDAPAVERALDPIHFDHRPGDLQVSRDRRARLPSAARLDGGLDPDRFFFQQQRGGRQRCAQLHRVRPRSRLELRAQAVLGRRQGRSEPHRIEPQLRSVASVIQNHRAIVRGELLDGEHAREIFAAGRCAFARLRRWRPAR